jgi:lysophospholipase L1-like esterase
MTIILTKPVRVGGVELAAATTQTFAADVEADLVARKSATYTTNPMLGGQVPVMADVNNFTGSVTYSSGKAVVQVRTPTHAGVYLTRKAPSIKSLLTPVYPDAEVEALITSIAVPNTAGKTSYRVLINALKKLGIWSSLANGFLFGSSHQPSAATIKSINGAGDATGTGTHSTYYTTLNGTTNGYTYTQTPSAAVSAKTVIAVFSDSNVSTGHNSHVWSVYAGGASKGPAIYSGGSSISGSGNENVANVYGVATLDGSAVAGENIATLATYNERVYAAIRQSGGRFSLSVHGKSTQSYALATAWNNTATVGIGINPSAGAYLAGKIFAVLDFSVALTDEQLTKVIDVLRYVFSLADGAQRYCAFEGNSLTASASGGGTTYPDKLMAKAEWATAFVPSRYSNNALSGAYESMHGEQQYYSRTTAASPVVGERNILFVWGGVNDITAGISAARIIASLDRHLRAAYEDGWDIYMLPITPVAPTSAGLSYKYSAGQLQTINDVNTYLSEYAGAVFGRYIDLYKIGDTYPKFLDATSGDYYVAGDGLHHNDAGRGLIADYIASMVTP